jgi:hypothetical protein
MLRSHRIPCSRVPAPPFVFLRCATPSHFHLHERPSHGYSISAAHSLFTARPLAVFRTPAPARISTAHSLFPACPRLLAFPLQRPLAISRTPARISTARSLFPAHPHPLAFPLRRPLAVSRKPARRFPRARSLPRASSPASRFPSASPRLASPSQALNTIKTGYRTSRVWIWSSKNGRQRGVGQPSQEGYQYDEETNSIQEE